MAKSASPPTEDRRLAGDWRGRAARRQRDTETRHRALRVAIFDVAVDIRRGSPTFGRHAHAILTSDNWRQVWVPPGVAHGYCTLEDDIEVLYKATDYYRPEHDRGIQWDDPALMIEWPVRAEAVIVSERDRKLPPLSGQPDLFEYLR